MKDTNKTPDAVREASPYVAGPIWAEPEDDCFTAEIQTVGGHSVIATVHGATRDEAEQRQHAILAALESRAGDAFDMPEYAPDDISHLEGLASYLDGVAGDKGRAGLPASKSLFEEIAKRLREYDVIRNRSRAGDAGDIARARQIAADTIGVSGSLRDDYLAGIFDSGDHVRIALASLSHGEGRK
ncbi:hypothetical protein BRX36_20230 [Sphingomonas sp. S-NIH.Pt1_0416]|uniref:hypothetical protein n=1 Tax=Sphingomonas sp. S-NIH.Pt1_0416 TaxID=1920123 RepID=UPI000F7E9E39|nr:hypothetical protein [Sphingomonas sp. S-NIH.Pt1_0416]RSU58593.1 hypothetical protein BRX36_20230 [Sphingomonas sp. S-NIH.Pt1_0416]